MEPVTVIAVIAYNSKNNSKNDFVKTIRSLNEGVQPPTMILLADSLCITNSIKKKDRVSVVSIGKQEITELDCFKVLDKAMKQSNKPYYYLITTPGIEYPVHLLQEYLSMHRPLNNTLKEKMEKDNKPFRGSVMGVSGVIMANNPNSNRNLDLELEMLLNGLNLPDEPVRNSIGYMHENATIDILELSGSVFAYSEDLNPSELISYDQINPDVGLANLCAQKGISRLQICTLTLNRFILEKMHILPNNKDNQLSSYLEGLEYLKKHDKLYLWSL